MQWFWSDPQWKGKEVARLLGLVLGCLLSLCLSRWSAARDEEQLPALRIEAAQLRDQIATLDAMAQKHAQELEKRRQEPEAAQGVNEAIKN